LSACALHSGQAAYGQFAPSSPFHGRRHLSFTAARFSKIPAILLVTARQTAGILMIVGAAGPFSRILGIEQAP
jgi:TRAP-type C4-dicarboxylate transport system permease large subunit